MSKNQEIELAVDLAAYTLVLEMYNNSVDNEKAKLLFKNMMNKREGMDISAEMVFNHLYDKYCGE